MKTLIAIDSFKGSLSSLQAGAAVREGILRACPDSQVIVYPLSDGGEGTADTLIEGLGGERIPLTVAGPDGTPVHAGYGLIHDGRTAVVEMASAAGLTLAKNNDPLTATTRGVGELILDALRRGRRDFIIGIGGSATNDGGIGMLKALGWSFQTASGADPGEGAQALSRISSILPPDEEMREVLSTCTFRVACDVKNPLCGKDGATFVYGPQKGVTPDQLDELDAGMSHFADIAAQLLRADHRSLPGAGAAGGMGFALRSFLNAQLLPGADLILEAIGLERALPEADFLITGEGRLDAQTAMGKAPAGAARLAKRHQVPVIAFTGSVGPGADACHEAGIDAYFPILRSICTPEDAMWPEQAYTNLMYTAEQVFRLLRVSVPHP